MNGAALDRRKVGREHEGITRRIFLEEEKLRVVRKRCAIVEVDLCRYGGWVSDLQKRAQGCQSHLPNFWPRWETGDGEVAGRCEVRDDMEL